MLCDKLLYSQGLVASCARSYSRLKDVTSNFIVVVFDFDFLVAGSCSSALGSTVDRRRFRGVGCSIITMSPIAESSPEAKWSLHNRFGREGGAHTAGGPLRVRYQESLWCRSLPCRLVKALANVRVCSSIPATSSNTCGRFVKSHIWLVDAGILEPQGKKILQPVLVRICCPCMLPMPS
jgi:hypothetical protein